ncbi:membrane protein insertase YidC [Bacteroidia bacterium]|nr:membrane protein insertase YidC [Bacteroidia bacterium]
MDKNTITGVILVLVVLVGFSYFNRPSKEQIEAQKKQQDSIAWIQQQVMNEVNAAAEKQTANSLAEQVPDSVVQAQLTDKYGNFGVSVQGEEQLITLQNDKLILQISTQGGRIYSAQLKNFTDYQKEPLFLFDRNEADFGVTFITANSRVLNTRDFYFEAIQSSDLQAILRLHAGEDKSLDFAYTLQPDNYLVDFTIISRNLQTELAPTLRTLDIQWAQKIRQQEKGRKFEEQYARLTYKFLSDNVEDMKNTRDDVKDIPNKLKWIGYKDQYFSTVLIADNYFETAKLDSRILKDLDYIKEYNTSTSLPYNGADSIGLHFYFGPNDFTLFKKYDKTLFEGQNLELEKLVPLGYWILRPINQYIIVPIFDWLTSWTGHLGLAIFLLTLIIRGALFPLTYKSLLSSAKMRVLKPQIEQITAKYPGQDNALVRQQKTMDFYKQMGVSPMAGCLPMLLQMPFILALFFLFPSSIELRHQSFLWADDLSTYDSLIHWNTSIPIIGNHISLFCLLMSLVQVINTKYTMDQQNTGQEQMPGMKLMMYIMPFVMFFFLNDYSSGLNYYYLVSTLITIALTIAFRLSLDEKKLLVKLEANKSKAKPVKKKSGFMARLEEAQRQQQAALREQQKKKNKR